MIESVRNTGRWGKSKIALALGCLLLAMVLCLGFTPQKAHAATYEVGSSDIAMTTQSVYPFLCNLGGKNVYKPGKFTLKFELHTSYRDNKYAIEIHQGSASGNLMASCEGSMYVLYDYQRPKLSVHVDGTGWEPGAYTIVIYNYYYAFGRWCESPYNPATFDMTIKGGSSVKINTSKLTIKQGKSKAISFSPKKNVTIKKTAGNKKITVTKAGKVKVSKKLKKGTYKITVKAYKNKKAKATKKIKIVVK